MVCRGENVEWVKRIGDGVWSAGTSMASGSRGLLAGVVCRDKYGEWVKRPVGGVWSVGSSMASGSRELLAECGLSGQVWRVGQEACWRRVVCRRKFVAWVKRIVGECGLWGRKGRVGQEACRWYVVCRDKFVAWVKGIGDGVWSVGTSLLRGSRGLLAECGLSGRKCCVGQRDCR